MKMLVLLSLLLGLAAPAGARTVPPPFPPPPAATLAVEPGPGRVPLVIESAASKPIALSVPGGGDDGTTQHLCDTPCTLFASPGRLELLTDPDVELGPQDVPPRGMRLRLRPVSHHPYSVAVLTVGGITLAAGGLLLLVLTPVQVRDNERALAMPGSDAVRFDAGPVYATGAVLLGVGLGAAAGGFVLRHHDHRSGVVARQYF
jgi:hypothetical protein